jgi:hypothetical protein
MTQGKVISLGMKEIKWTTADLNHIYYFQLFNQRWYICKRATSRWFFSYYNNCKVYSSHRETGSWEKFNDKYIYEVTQD